MKRPASVKRPASSKKRPAAKTRSQSSNLKESQMIVDDSSHHPDNHDEPFVLVNFLVCGRCGMQWEAQVRVVPSLLDFIILCFWFWGSC